jgi:hypothetical protein
MRFDRDLRAIIALVAAQTEFGDVRDKFSRLQQMSAILNLDNVRLCIVLGVFCTDVFLAGGRRV